MTVTMSVVFWLHKQTGRKGHVEQGQNTSTGLGTAPEAYFERSGSPRPGRPAAAADGRPGTSLFPPSSNTGGKPLRPFLLYRLV